jgi:hypothetical protein
MRAAGCRQGSSRSRRMDVKKPLKPPVVEVYRRPAAAVSPPPPAVVPSPVRSETPRATLPSTPKAKKVAVEEGAPRSEAVVRNESTPREVRDEPYGPELPPPSWFPFAELAPSARLPLGEHRELPALDDVADDELARAVADALGETEPAPRELVRRIGEARGLLFLRECYAKTRVLEKRGGCPVRKYGDGSKRRRTSGGLFLLLCRKRIEPKGFAELSARASLAVGVTPRPPTRAEEDNSHRRPGVGVDEPIPF